MPHNIVDEPQADACQLDGIKPRNEGKCSATIVALDYNPAASRRRYAMFGRKMTGILSASHSPTPGFRTNNSGVMPSIGGQLSDDRPSNQANSFLQDGREGPSRDHHATFGLKVKIA